VRGQHSSVLTVADPEGTLATLTQDLGLDILSEGADRYRLSTGAGEPGTVVDVIADPRADRGLIAGGTVHHVAFRVPDKATQAAWRDELTSRGHAVTEILDRQYFTSIYFREPGGTLFEIATDTPGFNIDEPLLELGRGLKLPPWLEPSREAIAAAVAPLTLPGENNPELPAASGDTVTEPADG
jgi:glyoxalase family protein